MSNDWRALYVKYAYVYQPILEYGLATAPAESKGLARIFQKYSIKKSSKVLDVSCGIGRHSIQLAKLGYETVGFDISPYFLKTAKGLAKKENLSIDRLRFYQGDSRFLEKILARNFEKDFDAIICMDGGLLRPTRREEHDLLGAMHRLSKKDSILAVDMYSREFFEKYFFGFYDSNWSIQYFRKARLERHLLTTYDRKRHLTNAHWRFYRRLQNDNLKHLVSVDLSNRIYSERDLGAILRRARWNPVDSYSGFDKLKRFTPDSLNLSMIAQKK